MIRVRRTTDEPATGNGHGNLWTPDRGPNVRPGATWGRVALIASLALLIGAGGSFAVTRSIERQYAEDELAAGTKEARGEGFEAGRAEGYDDGYETGKSEAETTTEDAFLNGYAEGRLRGVAQGRRVGYDNGWFAGYDEGWIDGCVSTFDDLESSRVYDEAGYWYLDRSQCLA